MLAASRKTLKSAFKGLVRWRPHADVHFAQEGEDIVLARLFSGQKNGFYIDVGAHHPRRFSNSYWAYQRGWRGINIDSAPGSRAQFNRVRPRDINIEACISETGNHVEFFVFPEGALNTAVSARKDEIENHTQSPGKRVVVSADRLGSILEAHLPCDMEIVDFMSIDVEGSEMAVLRTNDWSRCRPRVVVIEVLSRVLENVGESEEIRFLKDLGYVPVSMLYHSVVLVGDEALLATHWQTPPERDSGG